jgi:mevalonate kinase
LIAGEFTVLTGGDALAIPFNLYSGVWAKSDYPDTSLFSFGSHLEHSGFIDADRLMHDLEKGWQFKSNIPVGYGLGSSGALTAAIYYHYSHSAETDPVKIQRQLAVMEDHFHGKSSGFDPLISLKNQSFAVVHNELTLVPDTAESESPFHGSLYLLDSGTLRGGINSIQWFYRELEKPSFREKLNALTDYNHRLTLAWMAGRYQEVTELFHAISIIQFEYFQPLITQGILSQWARGLDTRQYYIKLCGKGGGGYYLVWMNEPVTEPIKGLTKVKVI